MHTLPVLLASLSFLTTPVDRDFDVVNFLHCSSPYTELITAARDANYSDREIMELLNARMDPSLTQEEREQIWNEIHFCVTKMYHHMDRAERKAPSIRDTSLRDVSIHAIQGAIGGIAGGNFYAMVIGSCLNTIAQCAGNYCASYYSMIDEIHIAKTWGYQADKLQERLWRDS